MLSSPFFFSMAQIKQGTLLIGALFIAILAVTFLWGFVEYIFYKGDDAERAHAKAMMLDVTVVLVLVLIVWWIVSLIGGYFPS